MRWYCVLRFRASFLKNSTLRLLKAMVTLTPSSRKTRSSGRGRKSGTTLRFPRGSSVYLIFPLIDVLALSPVAGPEDPDHVLAVREADRQDPAFDPPEAVMALLLQAVGQVFRDHTLRIREGQLRLREGDSVLSLVRPILRRLPLEPGLWHQRRLARIGLSSHTFVWRDGQCPRRPLTRFRQFRVSQQTLTVVAAYAGRRQEP